MRLLLAASAVLFLAILSAPCGRLIAAPADDLDPSTLTDNAARWKAVQAAGHRGLPKTAIEILRDIQRDAMASDNAAEAIRAVARRVAFQGVIEGNKPAVKIALLKAEMAELPAEMRPMMNAILANALWHYFQQNRWRFQQRTQTAAAPSEDLETWGLPRILAEVDRYFVAALAESATLRGTPIAAYDDLLDAGTVSDKLRPTVFDFLAHEAIDFYSAGEHAGNRRIGAFDVTADSPIFGSVDDFVAWEPATEDTDAPLYKAIRLYQDLLRFHAEDPDASARIDVDLKRLQFGDAHAFGEEKDARFIAALKRTADAHSDHELSALVLHALATRLRDRGELVQAHDWATTGSTRFPDSVGGKQCFNLVQMIQAKRLAVDTERVWSNPMPTIGVSYANLDHVFFRLVPLRYEENPAPINNRSQLPGERPNLTADTLGELLRVAPVRQWSATLEPTEDFHQRTKRVEVPADLPKGGYYLISSASEDFAQSDNQVSATVIWRSDLALVTRSGAVQNVAEGFVLHAETGAPIAGADVRAWWFVHRSGTVQTRSATTDADGRYRIPSEQPHGITLRVKTADDFLPAYGSSSVFGSPQPPPSFRRCVFFTDRSIYRPGQTIQFKGVVVAADQKTDAYSTVEGHSTTVEFRDVNGKQIESLDVRTNKYGSFSGSFTAPSDRLMGQMSIRDLTDNGTLWLRVEEYKRPKFRVEMDPIEGDFKLGDRVTASGRATAYTGATIGDAQVRWRVVRRVRYPRWWFWRCGSMGPQHAPAQEIARGVSRTSADGTFEVDFDAAPDVSVSPKSEPTFTYAVHADVTDSAGETRSTTVSIRLGYTTLVARIDADAYLTAGTTTEVRVETSAVAGGPRSVAATVEVFALRHPSGGRVQRADLGGSGRIRGPFGPRSVSGDKTDGFATPDPTDPKTWADDRVVEKRSLTTDAAGKALLAVELDEGFYRVRLSARDANGKPITAEWPLTVVRPDSLRMGLKVPDLFIVPEASVEPGDEFTAVWGSGYDTARAFVEVQHRGRLIQQFWTDPESTQTVIRQAVDESMRGGFTVRTTMVRENRAYTHHQFVRVPWTNKKLDVRWERFVSKLGPGETETWTAVISGHDGTAAVAEMVAGMYDASLDAFAPHHWQSAFNVFRQDRNHLSIQFQNNSSNLRRTLGGWNVARRTVRRTYRAFPNSVTHNLLGYQMFPSRRGRMLRGAEIAQSDTSQLGIESAEMSAPMAMPMEAGGFGGGFGGGPDSAKAANAFASVDPAGGVQADEAQAEDSPDPAIDLNNVRARENLNATAFFFPHLVAGEDGKVRITFTLPEALTTWKFMGFAHDEELRAGRLESTAVTRKDLMVQPNPPRFLRVGDQVEFTVKVTNMSPATQRGNVRLTLADARTEGSLDAALGNDRPDRAFEVPAGQSRSIAWRLVVPEGTDFLRYKAVGSTGSISDGEEGFLPVLTNRILVTESLPLPIRGKQRKNVAFTKLLQSGSSDTLRHQSLSVQMVSNPAWYAVMALPYLMEYPNQCSEQTFSRLYANAVARHIARRNPKIRRVFDQWRGTDALESPLEKNQDLKSVMLRETPWVRQAASESQARRNVGLLFDDNRLDAETRRAARRLQETQNADGGWPWFPGGASNRFITLYIVTGYGRLGRLGMDPFADADVDGKLLPDAIAYLDREMDRRFREIGGTAREQNHLNPDVAMYLYGRSFFSREQPIAPEFKPSTDYWIRQAQQHWLKLPSRLSQAHLAVALARLGRRDAATGIMDSLRQRSVTDSELGMFWRENERSWWWHRAEIETQAMMIEAFDEVADDQDAVELCKVWLLKQKQTQDWKTTKATADATYALLLRGANLLASDALVRVELNQEPLRPVDVQAGTGFYEQRFPADQITPALGNISLSKTDSGVAWGSVHWQYLEQIDKITPHTATPLALSKTLYRKENTDRGPTLVRVDGPLSVGDEVVVRIVLRTDRDMEYVHMRDHRGSGTEPVDVLSRYRFQDGLAYYESTRDTSTDFFIDYLSKGTYVFEYSTRIQLRGEYESGIATIQCMYAPEFNSHSESTGIVVK